MGLFSRKKKLEVPLPPSEDLLKFPKPPKAEREIKPEKLKEAVGLEKPSLEKVPLPKLPLPKIPPQPEKPPELPEVPRLPKPTFPEKPPLVVEKPFFLRIQRYRQLLHNLNEIKNRSLDLDQTNQSLEKSGFNENRNYEHLKNDLKKIHDRLLFMDDLIFKK